MNMMIPFPQLAASMPQAGNNLAQGKAEDTAAGQFSVLLQIAQSETGGIVTDQATEAVQPSISEDILSQLLAFLNGPSAQNLLLHATENTNEPAGEQVAFSVREPPDGAQRGVSIRLLESVLGELHKGVVTQEQLIKAEPGPQAGIHLGLPETTAQPATEPATASPKETVATPRTSGLTDGQQANTVLPGLPGRGTSVDGAPPLGQSNPAIPVVPGDTGLRVESWRAQYVPSEENGLLGDEMPLSQSRIITSIAPEMEGEGPPPGHEAAKPITAQENQRQDPVNQFIHAQIDASEEGEQRNSGHGESQFPARQNSSQEQSRSDSGPTAAQTSTRAQPAGSGQGQDNSLGFMDTTQHAGKTMPHSSGTQPAASQSSQVPDQHILNQVIERFSIRHKLESGTITLRLHPQELGELKMEIQVERDAIKAHIIAQNGHIQEILERNIPRLREALAQQNLELQVLDVTVADHTDERPSLFQDQHPGQYGSQQPVTAGLSDPSAEEETAATAPYQESVQQLSIHA